MLRQTDKTKFTGSSLAERLDCVVDALGGPSKASGLLGVTRDTVYKWKAGQTRIPFDAAYKMVRTAGVSMNWLATGIHKTSMPEADNGFTLIRRFDVALSAGNGSSTGDNEVAALAFPTEWLLSHIGTNKENLSVVQARGDSMEPTIQDRALVLVDHSIEGIKDDGIYAFRMNDALFIKRVQAQVTGGVLLLSDNTSYPSQQVHDLEDAQFQLLGRVRWVGNSL